MYQTSLCKSQISQQIVLRLYMVIYNRNTFWQRKLGCLISSCDWCYFCYASYVSKKQKQPSRGFFRKRCFEICSKFIGEHPCQSVISIKLPCNFIEIRLRFGCSPVSLIHIFRTPFAQRTSGEVPSKKQVRSNSFHRICSRNVRTPAHF